MQRSDLGVLVGSSVFSRENFLPSGFQSFRGVDPSSSPKRLNLGTSRLNTLRRKDVVSDGVGDIHLVTP